MSSLSLHSGEKEGGRLTAGGRGLMTLPPPRHLREVNQTAFGGEEGSYHHHSLPLPTDSRPILIVLVCIHGLYV